MAQKRLARTATGKGASGGRCPATMAARRACAYRWSVCKGAGNSWAGSSPPWSQHNTGSAIRVATAMGSKRLP
eukprot:2373592-Alexandrium_andersonii.AAC.1